MRNQELENVKEALQAIAKLELLLKMCNVYPDFKFTEVRDSDLIVIKDKLWKKYNELKEKEPKL